MFSAHLRVVWFDPKCPRIRTPPFPRSSITGTMGLISQVICAAALSPRLLRDESSPDIHATRGGMLLAESSPFRLQGTLVIRSTVAQPCGGLDYYYSR